jgi:uncharacterized integral membrane protein (TIGR00698 family)
LARAPTSAKETASASGLTLPASVVLVLALGALAFAAAPLVSVANEVVIALVSGLVIANLGGARSALAAPVSNFMLKRALKLAVILLGAGVDVALIRSVGVPALSVIIVAVGIALAVTGMVARQQGLATRPALLVGIGTAICGASAIAALAPVIQAKQQEVGVALATVLGFNAVVLLVYPVIGDLAGFDEVLFGTWAGVAVHDTASAVATGFAMGPEAGEVATVVKLVRILFLIPLLVVAARVVAIRGTTGDEGIRSAGRTVWKSVPWFVFGFAGLAAASSLGWLGPAADLLSDLAKTLIVFVVAAIGMTLRLKQVTLLGRKALVTGCAASLAIGIVSLLLIQAIGIRGL